MTQYGFYYDALRCSGCHTCELACKDYHDLSPEITFRHVYEMDGGTGFSQDSDGCWSVDSQTYYTSVSCQHCDNPACTEVCPTGAMHKDPDTGIVSVNADVCIGCGYCAMACPYKAPTVDRAAGHSVKCNGCQERVEQGLEPICVEACTGRALQFGPVDTLPEGKRAAISPLPDPSYTNPNLYINECPQSVPSGSDEMVIDNPSEVK
ncbi:MAG: 4Fe-4S dicluster domain-containing protein [Eggerthellaceae bacterium]|jgi:DMSO reductase iron-sulfur subunit